MNQPIGVCLLQVRRSGNEDMNLAMRADDEDYFNAEFVRTYKHSNFPGYELLKRLEERSSKCNKTTVFRERVIPCVPSELRSSCVNRTLFRDSNTKRQCSLQEGQKL